MASATVEKHTQGKAFAVGKHDFREAKRYSNGYVDLTRKEENLNLMPECSTAKFLSRAIKKRVAEIDAALPPLRVKKDRIVSVGIEFPMPDGTYTRGQTEAFFREALKELRAYLGEKNVMAAQVHFDEVHDYFDPGKKKMCTSRVHMHCEVIPFVPGKGVNGKAWLTKARYRELNDRLDIVALRTLGVPYQDGTKQKSRGKVDELKMQSALEIDKHVREQKAALEELQELVGAYRGELKAIQERTERLKNENIGLSADNTALKAENANLELLARQNIKKAKADLLTAVQRKQRECPELREWLIENGYGQMVREYTSRSMQEQMEAFESFLEEYE